MAQRAGPAVWFDTAGAPDRPAIVVVHGSMDRSAGLLRLSRRLDGDHLVVRYDRRGYGRSAAVGPPWTVDDNVEDLEAIIEQVVIAPAVIFGHSFGGNVALALAQRRPDLVHAVGVYESPLSWLDWWPGNSAGAMAMSQDDPGDAAEAFMRRLMGDELWERMPASKQAARRAEGAPMVAELADLRRGAPWSAERISAPVHAMYGEYARPHHRAAMTGLVELLPGCTSDMIAGAGHAGPHTHADAVAASFTTFLRSVGVSPRRAAGG
jgi:lipase